MAILWKSSVLEGTKLNVDTKIERIFQDLYTKQKQNVWFPEELNIQQDVHDYEQLSEQEKHIFDELIGYFTVTELLVQNVLWEAFYPHIASPRAKMAMTVQMFMEDIHSDFFEMVLNSFNMDKDAMYAIADNNPLLQRKRQMVTEAADSISLVKKEWEATINPNTLEGKKAILYAILVNNILQEWIFFYSAFAMFFAMREAWGKMKNFNNGMDLVLIDESLHLQMWIELILAILEENPEILDDASFGQKIHTTLIDWVELELECLKEQFELGNLFGLSYAEMEKYLYFVADRRLEELGLEPHYGVAKNPLTFLEKQDVMTIQNFFEVTPNQYTNF